MSPAEPGHGGIPLEQQAISYGRDLRTYIATIRHQKWIILSAVVLTLGATIFLTVRQVPSYSSEGQLQVNPVGEIGIVNQYSASAIDMPTERYQASSIEVAGKVAGILDDGTTPIQLQEGLNVSIQPDTHILGFSYTDPNPERAQLITQTFMTTYLQQRKQSGLDRIELKRAPLETARSQVSQTIKSLEKRARQPKGLTYAEQADLNTAYYRLPTIEASLNALRPDPESGGVITVTATLPTSPSSPNWSQNIVLAIFLGIALGFGVAMLRENLSEGLRGSKDLEIATGAAVLAAVPAVSGWRRRGDTWLATVEDPKSTTAEAYRTLRTNLLYVATMENLSVFAITSATLGEGKSTTTSNLAVALAQTGKRVIAVSCDLRKPRLHRFFGLSNDVGVTSILAGKATLAEAAQRPEGIETLRILASGPVPSNPAELLGSKEFDRLLENLRPFADIVLVDTPPTLAVSDTLVIGPKADGIIIVADAHNSSKGAVEHTKEQLEQVGAHVVGCVFNNYDPTQAKYYPYDKRYYYSGYYSYGYPDEPTSTPVTVGPAEGEAVPPEEHDKMWG